MSRVLTPNTLVKLKPIYRMQWEPAQAAHVLLYPEGMITLNDSAGEILQLCRGELTIAAIIAALEQKFPEAGSLSADIYEFLDVARTNGWIEPN